MSYTPRPMESTEAPTDASMILEADGRASHASPRALELLGVSLDQLRSLPPGAFSASPPDPDGTAAFRQAWEAEGSPDLGGEATIRRLDGDEVRVRFAISPMGDGRFQAILEPTAGAPEEPPTLYSAGETLALWRAAERRLATLDPHGPESIAIRAEIESFQKRYQDVFRRRT
jgi:PAS domain-containing protein